MMQFLGDAARWNPQVEEQPALGGRFRPNRRRVDAQNSSGLAAQELET